MEKEIIKELLNFINSQCRRYHDYCDDSWYSCPKSPEGCSNENEGTECNCGADKKNKAIDELIAKYRNYI